MKEPQNILNSANIYYTTNNTYNYTQPVHTTTHNLYIQLHTHIHTTTHTHTRINTYNFYTYSQPLHRNNPPSQTINTNFKIGLIQTNNIQKKVSWLERNKRHVNPQVEKHHASNLPRRPRERNLLLQEE